MGWWVGGWVYIDYNVSSGPFLGYEIEIGDGPGPELDNYFITRDIIYVSIFGLSSHQKQI